MNWKAAIPFTMNLVQKTSHTFQLYATITPQCHNTPQPGSIYPTHETRQAYVI
jgi:hypothetical protein